MVCCLDDPIHNLFEWCVQPQFCIACVCVCGVSYHLLSGWYVKFAIDGQQMAQSRVGVGAKEMSCMTFRIPETDVAIFNALIDVAGRCVQ